MNAEILAVGHELLMGEIVDTNSSYIAQQLAGTGITLRWCSQVGDNLDDLVDAFSRGLKRSDVVISTGGLGPTSDDLTREAVARTLGETMTVDPDTLTWLRGVFARRGMPMPETNIKQATLIPSATTIPNPNGTAPGWWVTRDDRHIVLLPGPPREIRQMWDETVGPKLALLSGGGVIATRTLKTYGMSEGGIDEILSPLFGRENPYLGIYAHADGIHLRIIARGRDIDAAQGLISPVESEIRSKIGRAVWGVDNETPASRVGSLLAGRGWRVGVAEGASAGVVSSILSAHPSRDDFFTGALVGRALNGTPASPGPDTALTMAEMARNMLDADLGLSITQITGDMSDDPPAGTVFVGMVSGSGHHLASARFPRRASEWVMQRSATTALVELVTALTTGRI